jgi:hypothetical protein
MNSLIAWKARWYLGIGREIVVSEELLELSEEGDRGYPGLGPDETLSCVARAEPRNKLWGMTVAPKIPTATIIDKKRVLAEPRIFKLTCIKCTRCENVLGRKEALKSCSPVHFNL